MNEIKEYTEKLFENIKHIDENGNEYWLARELMPLLEYNKWERFSNAIEYAKTSCIKSGYNVSDHFPEVGKLVQIGSKTNRKLKDYKLSRYACYLIVQNGDSRKEAIALGQTYFAIQTRKQELNEKEYSKLTEDEKRFYQRDLTRKGNYSLNIAARNAGVKNFDKFHNSGYKGLYNGETAKDIANRKGISDKEDILDYMSSTELAANLFRITQTDEVLKNKNINNEDDACITHHKVGQAVRQTIKKIGGTMPEELPTPTKSAKQIEKEKNKKITFNNKKRLK